jgi:hypothetical protein
MPVEQLLNTNINARDFHPVEERSVGGLEKRFEKIRAHFYDSEREYWRLDDEQNEDDSYTVFTKNQLLAVLSEGLFNSGKALHEYESLKSSPLYDKQHEQWKFCRYEYAGTPGIHGACILGNELLGILFEGIFDKQKAEEKYELLKQTRLYDKENKMWYYAAWDKEGLDQTIFSNENLLGVVVEGMFDKKNAKKLFEDLKKTQLYDSQRNLWRGSEATEETSYFSSYNQLLGILAEGTFDKAKAERKYTDLKQTRLYNNEHWNEGITGSILYTKPLSETQLAEILVEAMFEEPDFTPKKVEPVPEVRRF